MKPKILRQKPYTNDYGEPSSKGFERCDNCWSSEYRGLEEMLKMYECEVNGSPCVLCETCANSELDCERQA